MKLNDLGIQIKKTAEKKEATRWLQNDKTNINELTAKKIKFVK